MKQQRSYRADTVKSSSWPCALDLWPFILTHSNWFAIHRILMCCMYATYKMIKPNRHGATERTRQKFKGLVTLTIDLLTWYRTCHMHVIRSIPVVTFMKIQWLEHGKRRYRQTNRQTDGQTDGQTDRHTKPSIELLTTVNKTKTDGWTSADYIDYLEAISA